MESIFILIKGNLNLNNQYSNYRAYSSNLDLSFTNHVLYIGKSIESSTGVINAAFSSLIINDFKVDLIHDSFDIMNIKFLNTCQNVECKNNGYCFISQNLKGFKCNCKKPYYGEYCENLKQCFDKSIFFLNKT